MLGHVDARHAAELTQGIYDELPRGLDESAPMAAIGALAAGTDAKTAALLVRGAHADMKYAIDAGAAWVAAGAMLAGR
jgi:hypothetical protein